MKRSTERIVSLAAVTAMLASVAAMHVSAVESNVYSVSYETLTARH